MKPKVEIKRRKRQARREGKLNELLLKHGRRVFRSLDGFKNALWMRRIGVKFGGRNSEMDFVLLDEKSPRLGVVETTLAMDGDISQLKKYSQAFAGAGPNTILDWLERSLAEKKGIRPGSHTRARANKAAPLALALRKSPERIAKLVNQAKKKPIQAILVLYLDLALRGKPRLVQAVPLRSRVLATGKKTEWSFCIVAVD